MIRWQSELPGVGDAYQVSVDDMLRGLAVHRMNDADGERFWKYMPAELIMCTDDDETAMTVEQRTSLAFDTLFGWKERWLLGELQPYLDVIVDATSTTQANLLIQYTKVTEEDFNGATVKLYQKR